MIALCQEHRLEHRTKHIALRYFLARELQQRGQLRLAYVATRANTADVFTKALPPGDHQRFVTVLGLQFRVKPTLFRLLRLFLPFRLFRHFWPFRLLTLLYLLSMSFRGGGTAGGSARKGPQYVRHIPKFLQVLLPPVRNPRLLRFRTSPACCAFPPLPPAIPTYPISTAVHAP
ncbi:unnamed protein product [Closterium sp. NIES-53]